MTAQSATVMQPVRDMDLIRRYSEDVFDQLTATYNLIAQRAFEIFESRGGSPGREMEDWLQAESELLHPFPINVAEFSNKFVVRAEVPGLSNEDLKIALELRRLAILGEREPKPHEETARTIASDWHGDRLMRVIELPSDIDTARATRTVKDGILTVELPKKLNAN